MERTDSRASGEMDSTTSCLAVDDHAVLLRGLDLTFEPLEDLTLTASFSSGEEALAAIAKLKPALVLMDIRLPGIDGISTVKRLREQSPDVAVVVFTAYGDRRLVTDALQAGALGYVMKGAPTEDLVRAVRTALTGKPFVDPSLVPALLADDGAVRDGALSEREREIVQLLAEGHHNEEIAGRIGLSAETVKSDTRRAIAKLEAQTRTHAVAIALRQALIA
jgi:DNA-binding NarL/FixJ family response regulator